MRGKSKRYPLGIITVGFIALYMLLSCNSGDPNRQKEPIKSRDLKTVKRLAEQGDADAQFYLGEMYAKGQGISDKEEAFKWYTKAAKPDMPMHSITLLGCIGLVWAFLEPCRRRTKVR